jgi:quaternary ammonium compound-resistance protein SugE
MPWTLLFLAGLFEVGWAIGLKYTEGFTKPVPTALTVVSMLVSIGSLGLAMRHLPVGTAYAVWTGIGTVGTVLLGIVLLGDSASAGRLACVGLIVLGIVGLKLAS